MAIAERVTDALEKRRSTRILLHTLQEAKEDQAPRLSAAIAYYAIFSLGPIILLVVAIAGLVLGGSAAMSEVTGAASQYLGADAAQAIGALAQAVQRGGGGLLATVVGFLFLIVGATGVFAQLKSAINTAWEIEPKEGGALDVVKDRLSGLAVVLLIGFLLLALVVATTVLHGVTAYLSDLLPVSAPLWWIVNTIISLGVITLLFAALFKALPDADVEWHQLWLGAAFTALLFFIGKEVLALYIGRNAVASAAGAAGAIVALLLWIYYSALIFLIGAEFTQVYAAEKGHPIQPEEGAVRTGERPGGAGGGGGEAGGGRTGGPE